MKPKRPCGHPGCIALTDQRYCETHREEHSRKLKRKEYEKTRESASSRGYDSRWTALRNAYLRRHPLCEMCHIRNMAISATLVHHKQPIADGGARLNWDNLMALCNDCHEDIHGHYRYKKTIK